MTKDDIKREVLFPVLNEMEEEWGVKLEMEKIDYLAECVVNTGKYVKIYLFFDKKKKKLVDEFYVIPRDDRKKEYGMGLVNADSMYIVALGNSKYGHSFNN